MNKLNSFREALLAGVPEFARDPDKLSIMAERGRMIASGEAGLGWQYAYQLTFIVQDFAGDMDRVTHTILQWVRKEQPGLLRNPELAEKSIRFEVEAISSELVDIQIEIDLTEAVRSQDGVTFDHLPEPRVNTWAFSFD